jgi:hypothetical protein
MQAPAASEHLDVVDDRAAGLGPRAPVLAGISSVRIPNQDSATALYQHWRGRYSDWIMRCSARRAVNSAEVTAQGAIRAELAQSSWAQRHRSLDCCHFDMATKVSVGHVATQPCEKL